MRQINDWTTTKAVFLDPIEVVEKLVLVLKGKLIFILKSVNSPESKESSNSNYE